MCTESQLLKDKVAIVTGSSRGIGAETARLLAANGAKVAVNFHASRERGAEVLREIEFKGGAGILVQADVTDLEQVGRMVREVQEQLGPVDILVNNANMHFPVVPFTEFRWEDFERKVTGEMKALFFPCQAVVPGMIARGRGCIVNISSGLSRQPGTGYIAHSSAKSALDAFSKSLATELGPLGVRVNVVAPGLTETDATSFVPPQVKQMIAGHTPMRRIGVPGDVAGVVLFLCTEWAQFVTGCYIPVSGGSQML